MLDPGDSAFLVRPVDFTAQSLSERQVHFLCPPSCGICMPALPPTQNAAEGIRPRMESDKRKEGVGVRASSGLLIPESSLAYVLLWVPF